MTHIYLLENYDGIHVISSRWKWKYLLAISTQSSFPDINYISMIYYIILSYYSHKF